MTQGKVSLQRQGHVLLIGLDRESKYNAFDLEMFHDLAHAYFELEHADELRCGVVFGHGQHFTAGIDLAQWATQFASGEWPTFADDELDPIGLYGKTISKPIIIAVQGICFTIGIELLLSTDIRVAADNTRFAQIEIKRGIYPIAGATIRLPMQCGWGNSMRYLLTGDEFDANEAFRIGLVQEVVPAGKQVEKAVEIAETVARQAPMGVYATLKSSRRTRNTTEQEAMKHLLPELVPLMQSEDVQEGLQSFLERRDAVFKGK